MKSPSEGHRYVQQLLMSLVSYRRQLSELLDLHNGRIEHAATVDSGHSSSFDINSYSHRVTKLREKSKEIWRENVLPTVEQVSRWMESLNVPCTDLLSLKQTFSPYDIEIDRSSLLLSVTIPKLAKAIDAVMVLTERAIFREQALATSAKTDDPDWNDPFWQDMPESRAILDFIRALTAHFLPIQRDLSEAEWTAFRSLASKGVVEGMIRLSFTDQFNVQRVEHYSVQGDYIPKMPKSPLENWMDAVLVRRDGPLEILLTHARLTGLGEGWAQYLAGEKGNQIKVRGFVLSLHFRAEEIEGRVVAVPPPNSENIPTAEIPLVQTQRASPPTKQPQTVDPPPKPRVDTETTEDLSKTNTKQPNQILEYMIDLDQAAALVNRSKKTLQRALADRRRKMPSPKIQGVGGKKSEWLYSELKPWLEKEFERLLPDRPPHTIR